jgi:hypothetical protein
MSCAFSSWGRYQESLAGRRFGLRSVMGLTHRSNMGDLGLRPLKYVSEAPCRPPPLPPASSFPEGRELLVPLNRNTIAASSHQTLSPCSTQSQECALFGATVEVGRLARRLRRDEGVQGRRREMPHP